MRQSVMMNTGLTRISDELYYRTKVSRQTDRQTNILYAVFGEVMEGFDVLEKISETICDDKHRSY